MVIEVVMAVGLSAAKIIAPGAPSLLPLAKAVFSGRPSTTYGATSSTCGQVFPWVATCPGCHHNSTPSMLHPTKAPVQHVGPPSTPPLPPASTLKTVASPAIPDPVDRGVGLAIPDKLH
jgi:hypothetical protein